MDVDTGQDMSCYSGGTHRSRYVMLWWRYTQVKICHVIVEVHTGQDMSCYSGRRHRSRYVML